MGTQGSINKRNKETNEKKQPHLAGSVRAALGKVIGSSEKSIALPKKSIKFRVR